jgi:hypothetical protein
MSPQYCVKEYAETKQRENGSKQSSFLAQLISLPEDGGDMFLRNVD